MIDSLIEDALRVAREHGCKDVWKGAAHYLAGQLEIAIRDTQQGFSRLPPQQPTRPLKVDKNLPPLAVSKY